jgi:hypothetical protein
LSTTDSSNSKDKKKPPPIPPSVEEITKRIKEKAKSKKIHIIEVQQEQATT